MHALPFHCTEIIGLKGEDKRQIFGKKTISTSSHGKKIFLSLNMAKFEKKILKKYIFSEEKFRKNNQKLPVFGRNTHFSAFFPIFFDFFRVFRGLWINCQVNMNFIFVLMNFEILGENFREVQSTDLNFESMWATCIVTIFTFK